jgi:hypothetical protein
MTVHDMYRHVAAMSCISSYQSALLDLEALPRRVVHDMTQAPFKFEL